MKREQKIYQYYRRITRYENLKRYNYYNKKKINKLKNELDSKWKEIGQKRMGRDKEREDIFKDNNNPKLKNEYYKLLQDYDNNINDFKDFNDLINE